MQLLTTRHHLSQLLGNVLENLNYFYTNASFRVFVKCKTINKSRRSYFFPTKSSPGDIQSHYEIIEECIQKIFPSPATEKKIDSR